MSYYIGKGFVLTVAGTTIGQIVSWSGPEMAFGSVETTHMGSSQREFMGTIQDSGTATFVVNWDPETAGSINHPTLLSQFKLGTNVAIVGDVPQVGTTADVFTASGHLTSFAVQGVTVDAVWQVSIGVKFTGDITIA